MNLTCRIWRLIAHQDENRHGVFSLLTGHTDSVNVVQFMTALNGQITFLLSGSVDKSIRVWEPVHGSFSGYQTVQTITAHESSVNCIATLPRADLFASGSSDGTINIWSLDPSDTPDPPDQSEFRLKQKIKIAPKFLPLAMAMASLGDCSNILAAAGTESTIQVYVSKGGEFTLTATLTGHEGWIRALDFVEETVEGARDILLASASQDKYIRLWRIHEGEDLPAASRAANDPALGVVGRSLSNKAHRFLASEKQYSITFEALLLGHEDWIYMASWHTWENRIQLLSASADNSLAVWEADPASGIWVCSARLGEISTQKGSTTATGSTGGFWIGLWSPNANAVVSLGRTGGWRFWKRREDGRWAQDLGVTGHTKEVKSMAWARNGAYLLSTGSDQTTRLHGEWKRDGISSWHEFSRPQIHGYDLNCIDTITDSQFISGADEKLLRVFDEPAAVANILQSLSGVETEKRALPDAANIPVLGLSNKAIEISNTEGEMNGGTNADPALNPHHSLEENDRPPFEDQLSRHLLFPETEKLYGHGYEISCVAASHDGSLIATACRASSIDHALIRLYETKDWLEIRPALRAHSLTVTSLKFSLDDKYLLSVGRDRQWTVFERNKENKNDYKLLFADPKAHSRMILDCSWAPSDVGRVFATAGRDKTLKIWKMSQSRAERKSELSSSGPITSLEIKTELQDNSILLAFGLETGLITSCLISRHSMGIIRILTVSRELCPSKAITQLRWRPIAKSSFKGADSSEEKDSRISKPFELAVASDDTSIRILALNPFHNSVH